MIVHLRILAASVLAIATLLSRPGVAPARAVETLEQARLSYRSEIATRRRFVVANFGGANIRRDAKFYPFWVLAKTKLSGCGDGALADYMADVFGVPAPGDPGAVFLGMFPEPPVTRYLYMFGGCLGPDRTTRLRTILSKPHRLFDHGTLNQASMMTTSTYLLAQFFPDLTWTDIDRRTYSSAEVLRRQKTLMLRRYRKFLADGENEALSPTYAILSLSAALNVVEFARDDELRAYAEAYAVQLLAILRVSSFDGVILAPLSRQNAQQRSGPSSTVGPCVSPTQHALWLYFEEPRVGGRDLDSSCEPTYVAMLALSEWTPPVLLSRFPDAARLPLTHTVTLPDFGIWDAPTRPALIGTVMRSRHFAIGSGNAVFDPAGYNVADSTFTLAMSRPGAEYDYVECVHPYWTSDLGPDAWSSSAQAPAHAPNASSRSSPFQQSFFAGGRGVILFSIPERDPWQYGSDNPWFARRRGQRDALFGRQMCHLPARIDEQVALGSWVFWRVGETYLGIETVGLTPTLMPTTSDPAFLQIATEARHAAYFFVVAERDSYASFAAFRDAAKAVPRRHDPARDTFEFTGETGRAYRVEFSLRPDGPRIAALPVVTSDGVPLPPLPDDVIRGDGYRIGRGTLHVETPLGSLDILPGPDGRPLLRETPSRP